MAASKPVEATTGGNGTGSGIPRWQLALVIGVPLIGVGAIYLWNRRRRGTRAGGKGTSERKTPEGRASPAFTDPSGGSHLDGAAGGDEMVRGGDGRNWLRAGKGRGDFLGRRAGGLSERASHVLGGAGRARRKFAELEEGGSGSKGPCSNASFGRGGTVLRGERGMGHMTF